MNPWRPSQWLIQSSPPDMAENRNRWTFGLYEIIDRRETPVNPKVVHVTFRGQIELEPAEVPDPEDPMFSVKLEEAVLAAWEEGQSSLRHKQVRTSEEKKKKKKKGKDEDED